MYQAGTFAELLRSRAASPDGAARLGGNVLFLGLTSLVTDVSSEMVAAVLPLYLVYSLELSPLHLGVIDGLYQGAAALVRIAAGVAADRWRRLKEVAGAGYALSAACKLGLLAAGSSAALLAGVVVLDRTGKGIRAAPRDALLSLSAPAGGLATAFGIHRALDTAGATLGPLVAFALLALVPGGFDVVFLVSFCVAVIGLALFALFVEGRSAPGSAADAAVSGGGPIGAPAPPASAGSVMDAARLLASRPFRALVLVGAGLGAAAISDGLVYLVLQRRVGFGLSYVPLLYVGSALVYMLLAVPAGRLADRIGRERVLLGGYGLLAALYGLLLAGRPSWPTVGGAVLLLGASYAATDGVLMALASPILPAAVRASGLAVLATCTSVARLIASIAFGAVWTWWGADRALLVFLVAMLAAIAGATLGWGRRAREARA